MDSRFNPQSETAPEHDSSDPYPPSWVDRLTDSFRNSRLPSLALYAVLGIAAMMVGQAALWFYGITPTWEFDTVSVAVGIWVSFSLASIHYLDDLARDAIEAFRPALSPSEEEFVKLRYILTTMPPRPLVFMNLATAFVTILANLVYPDIFESFLGKDFQIHPILLISAAALGVSGSLIYHTVRQLGIIRSVYSRAPRLTIFDAKSTYAFSSLTVSTALAWALILYLGVLTVPGIYRHPIWAAVSIAILLVILVSIGAVLVHIHNKLSEEKSRLAKEATDRLVGALSRIHEKYDHADLADIGSLHHLVQALSHERDLLHKIPTWPWQPGTLVTFISALVLPVAIFVIQEVVRRLTGL